MAVSALDLNGTWKLLDCAPGEGEAQGLHQPGLEAGPWMDTAVPGDVHPTLIEAGRLEDPFWGLNVEESTWTGHRDWWHRRSFAAPADIQGKQVSLVFEGVDTYAVVYLNGERLGECGNMFLPYRFDVTDKLNAAGDNVVAVCVRGPVPVIEARDTSKYFACFYTPRIFARKAQCQFSWDWAPNLPGAGIWQGVHLDVTSPGVVEDVFVQPRMDGTLFIKLHTDTPAAESRPARTLDVRILDGAIEVARGTVAAPGPESFLDLRVDNPKLWWPNGYGEPHLYEYEVTLLENAEALDTRRGRFGIREVELIEEAAPGNRHSFTFRVNGTVVFCQGGNWVPAGCFPGTVTREHYAHLIRLTREAHFNMLRVWGGGIYEQDVFYDLCDENGIMIWQDLMFACADIPDDDLEFTRSLIPEFEHQVRRLRNHPCITHWCGGNEKTGTFGAMMSYGDTISRYLGRGVVNDLHPGLAYTPSSPYSHTGVGNDATSGDTHGGCWEHAFVNGIRDFRTEVYKKNTVFNSEFGATGPCQMRSLRKFMPEDKLWPLGEEWELHVQDNPYNELEESFVQVQYKCASELFHTPDSAAEFVKVAGAYHAELLREEMEHHRRRFPENTGAVVWMLNDCWPCASWSLIDYYGLPKHVYYALKRACAPQLLSFKMGDDVCMLYLTNSDLAPVSGRVTVRCLTLDGEQQGLWHTSVSAPGQSSEAVLSVPRAAIPAAQGIILHAEIEGWPDASTVYFPNLWHDTAWPDPQLTVEPGPLTEIDGEYAAKVRVRAGQFARCVNLSLAEDMPCYWQDNFFDLMPGEERVIEVRAGAPFEPAAIQTNHWLTVWDEAAAPVGAELG